jgi:hypothetical protein
LPKLAISRIPDELLVEIFDFYRQHNVHSYQWWFKFIHVCKRWRAVMFASSSRLDLCFVLKPKMGGHMKTIMSRHFPPLPIQIKYDREYPALKSKDMSRVLAALKRPDRIRGIAFTGDSDNFRKLFKATKCPFPALESLELCVDHATLTIPVTFLRGSVSHLRTLSLHHFSLQSISRFLSSIPTLTYLSLVFYDDIGLPSSMLRLFSNLQSMPCLCHLHLEITSRITNEAQPTKPEEKIPLSKLTSFRYHGHSAFLNTFMAEFAAPSLREVDIQLGDNALPPIPYIPQFIDDIGEHYHAVRLSLDRYFVQLSLFGHSEYAGHHSPRFILRSKRFPESMMQMSGAFYSKIVTTELSIIFLDNVYADEDFVPWRRFFLQFPSLKGLRMYGTNNLRIATAFHQDHEGLNLAFLPALEEIELCMGSIFPCPENQCASELAAFEPFVSARQQVGLPVKIVANWRQPNGDLRSNMQ